MIAHEDDLLTSLIKRYGRALRRHVAAHVANDRDVDDVLQETYARLLKYRDAGELAFPQALAFKVVDSVLRDRHRRLLSHRASAHIDIGDTDFLTQEITPERTLEAEQQVALLTCAIEELSPKCRRAFLLSRLHNLTRAQIAVDMKISVQMVSKYLAQAMAHCRRAVEGDAP